MPDWLKEKISIGNKGNTFPGRVLSENHKKNISLARKKEWINGERKMWKLTPEIIEKIRQKSIGRKVSTQTRIKQSLVRLNNPKTPRQDKHHRWKGGITNEIIRIRHSVQMKIWRESIFKRDNYTCVWCGQRGVTLNADHIKPFALFPELRFDIKNGRTLCRECHLKTNTYGGKTKS